MRSSSAVAVGAAAFFVAGAFAAPAFAPNPFATGVVGYAPGPGVSPAFNDPAKALGGPQGCGLLCGSLDVVTLGVGGTLTLDFDVPISNGQGDDFIVFENAFQVSDFGPPTSYAEVVFVEVSSGGPFARFPVSVAGVSGTVPTFGSVPIGAYDGLAGGVPTIVNVATNTLDPLDPTYGGGTAFDLSDLRTDPLVLSGQVDLDAIVAVRLVDVEAGTVTDASGFLIYDTGGVSGAADIDAISVINHAQNRSDRQPRVHVWQDQQGFVRLDLSDPEGLGDLVPASLKLSRDLRPIHLPQLFAAGLAQVVDRDPTRVRIRIAQLMPYPWVFSASIRDTSGRFCVDQAMIH